MGQLQERINEKKSFYETDSGTDWEFIALDDLNEIIEEMRQDLASIRCDNCLCFGNSHKDDCDSRRPAESEYCLKNEKIKWWIG